MAQYDMTTIDGLRTACEKGERRLDQDPRVARIAGFLQEVQNATPDERESEAFLHRIFEDSPLYPVPNKMDVQAALADPEFRRQFRELTDGPPPKNAGERAVWLEKRRTSAKKLAWPDATYGSDVTITRAFAALFPHDFTAHRSPARKPREASKDSNLYGILGGDPDLRGTEDALVNRWILDRLEEAIDPVDRSDWNAVARRMMLPEILVAISEEERPPSGAELGVPPDQAPEGNRSELRRITEHFESIQRAGTLIFDQKMVESLHLGLWTRARRHFAVLTGLSGAGKTLLAIEYAKAVTGEHEESNDRICTIAVQPGWYDSTPLLGYVNPLGENRYIATEFLRFLIRANENPSRPHVCVLDEMNLSHPEQYLAPILSAMELDDGKIDLHGGHAGDYGIPPSIPYPGNLVLIGTVNMDETTMGISDKVLDRAFTLEFWDVEVDRWPGWETTSLGDQDREATMEVLTRLMEALSGARLHFGWRVIEEVVRFMEQRQGQDAELSVNDALDRVLYAKILPKLRGDDSPRFRSALEDCRTALNERNLSRSTRKVDELTEDVEQTGSFRFWR